MAFWPVIIRPNAKAGFQRVDLLYLGLDLSEIRLVTASSAAATRFSGFKCIETQKHDKHLREQTGVQQVHELCALVSEDKEVIVS